MIVTQPYPQRGLYVRLVKAGPLHEESDPVADPITVCIADAGPGVIPKLYVNSSLTSWDGLKLALENRLKVRPPKWTVYVESDPNIPWADAVTAVDIAESEHAIVVLQDLENPGCVPALFLEPGGDGLHAPEPQDWASILFRLLP